MHRCYKLQKNFKKNCLGVKQGERIRTSLETNVGFAKNKNQKTLQKP